MGLGRVDGGCAWDEAITDSGHLFSDDSVAIMILIEAEPVTDRRNDLMPDANGA